MFWFVVFWLFVFGLAIGSFLNVVVFRTISGDSPLRGRSYCDHCGKQLSWKHNIPLISFFLLRGRCAKCHKKISWQYPVVELITGVLFVWWYLIGKSFFLLMEAPWVWLQPVFWLGLALAIWLIVVFDLVYGMIPDFMSVMILLWIFGYRIALYLSGIMRSEDFVLSIVSAIGLSLFFLSLNRITRGRGFGMGDVKLAPSIGLLLGWPQMIVGVMSSFIIGSIVGLTLMAMGKKKFGQTLPFVPFLAAGALVSLLWGDLIWGWYFNLLK